MDYFWPVDNLWIVKIAEVIHRLSTSGKNATETSYPQLINSGYIATVKSYPQLINIEQCQNFSINLGPPPILIELRRTLCCEIDQMIPDITVIIIDQAVVDWHSIYTSQAGSVYIQYSQDVTRDHS